MLTTPPQPGATPPPQSMATTGTQGASQERSETRSLVLAASTISLGSSLACLGVVWAFLPAHKSLWVVLMKWDARWYQTIALHGYSWNPNSTAQQTPNFFPLYPLFERAGHAITGLPISHVAVVSSIVFQAVAAALLALIARDQGASKSEALAWVTMFLISPPVVADIMGYYSALLCVLCFVALYLAPRGHIWLAAVAIGLASAANPLGVAFAAGLITWELIRIATSRSLNWGSVARLVGQGLVSVSGLIGYCLYLLVAFRDPLAFYQATKGWSVPVGLPTVVGRILSFEPLRGAVTSWAAAPYGPAVNFLLDAVVALVVVALIVALVAIGDEATNFGFWLLVFAFLLLQALSARWSSEIGAMRILLPVAFGVGSVGPVRRFLTRVPVFFVVSVLLLATTTFLLQHLATGQWLD